MEDAAGPSDSERAIGARIAEAAGKRSVKEIAEVAGCSVQTARRMLKGSGLEAGRLIALAAAFEVSLIWLLTGSGPMREGHAQPKEDQPETVAIPVISAPASAGAGTILNEDAPESGWVAFPRAFVREFGTPSRLRLVKIVGDSMVPDLADGDWMLINLDQAELQDGIALVRLDDALLVKRLQPQGRTVLLTSSNRAYDPIPVDLKTADFAIIGRGRLTGRNFA